MKIITNTYINYKGFIYLIDMGHNFHNKAFDDGTLIKLDIWRRYLCEWIPVFIMSGTNTINIFDFFSGPGMDDDGNPGSPLIALEESEKYANLLIEKNQKINFYFFDSSKSKINNLKTHTEKYKGREIFIKTIEQLNFNEAYANFRPYMNGAANLIFVDQCGIKEMTVPIFNDIASLPKTDLLFYIASSYFKRFKETKEFQQYINIDPEIIQSSEYSDIHRVISRFYRNQLPTFSKYKIAPFSIKKGSNIYGLIFGTNHLDGVHKFLNICWKIDPERGEANYDIDKERLTGYPLFPDLNKANKLVQFEASLKENLLTGEISTDADVYRYALEQGFLPSQAKTVIRKLIKEKLLHVENNLQPRISKASLESKRKLITTS